MTPHSVAAKIRALQQAPIPELADQYRRVFGGEPASTRRSWMFRRLAWQLQADAHGGLSERAQTRLDALMAELPPPPPPEGASPRLSHVVPGIRRKGRLLPGTVLEREYHGTVHRVTVLDEGFEHAGVIFRSLSAVAAAITGSRWNGRLFFGLTKRSRGR